MKMGKFVNVRDDGIIFLTSAEEMSDADVVLWNQEYLEIINNAPTRIKVLTYAGNLKISFTPYQRNMIASTLKQVRPKVYKSAIYGMSTFIRILFQVVTGFAGRKDIRIFNNENDAVHWLNE